MNDNINYRTYAMPLKKHFRSSLRVSTLPRVYNKKYLFKWLAIATVASQNGAVFRIKNYDSGDDKKRCAIATKRATPMGGIPDGRI